MRETFNQFLRFATVGAVATAAHYSVLIALKELAGVGPLIATTCGFGVGAVVSYSLNRIFTFATRPSYGRGLVKFLIVVGVGALLNVSIVAFFIEQGLHYLIAQLIATGIVLIWNFTGARLVVFRA